MADKKKQYWDSIAKLLKKDKANNPLWRAHSDAVNVALVARWMPPGQVRYLLKTDLFDEALGDGLCPMLTSQARQVVGIDVSSLILRIAQSDHNGLQTIGADVCFLPFADAVLDVVVSNSTLDHFSKRDNILTSLREFHRVLRPAGLLIITLDNLANPVIALRNALPFPLLYRLDIVPYYVGASFGPRHLCLKLKEVGLDLLETTAIMHCPRVFAVMLTHVLERYTRPKTQKRFLRALMAFERLSRLPTRFLTGYFVAVRAIKR